jgi:hypothetical protein
MFKGAKNIFLLIAFFVIIFLFWLIINYCDFNSAEFDDEAWLKEYGLSLNIWPEGEPDKNDWAELLSDCLAKSDNLSQARCHYILEQINSFDDCAMAGFAIIESYPKQCRTSDNRLFIDSRE